MILRDYQIRTLDAVWAAMQVQKNTLMVAPCGSGKTILFSKLAQRLLREHPNFRVLILVDREILVRQSAEKLAKVAPELALSIGIVCSGVQSTKELDQPVTVASRQTLEKQILNFPPVQLCICDEMHLIPIPHRNNKPGQYERILAKLREYNPNMRLVGCTATPYRLGPYGGYIYGSQNRSGSQPYFHQIDAEITTTELLASGYVAPLKGLTRVNGIIDNDLASVGMVAGEFNLGQLSDVMCRKIHVQSVVDAWTQQAKSRKKTIIFCTTTKHVGSVCAAFQDAGILAIPIHSGLPPITLAANMQALENGSASIFVSVAMLTTGLDVVDVDCLILARPTKSAALHKQILGRGQRLAPGKTDCLVIDLVGSFGEFGIDLDNLRIAIPRDNETGEAPSKICPSCKHNVHASLRYCPGCGYEFEITGLVEAALGSMLEVKFRNPVEPDIFDVQNVFYNEHLSRSNGKCLIRVDYDCGMFYGIISEYLCLPDEYEGFAVEKAKSWWAERSDEPFPETVDEFLFLSDSIIKPARIHVIKDGKYDRIVNYDWAETDSAIIQEQTDDIPF